MPRTEFLDELKIQYERVLQSRANLDSKSSSLTATSGIIETLLMGFGVFMLQMLNQNYQFYFLPIVVLIAGILLHIASIVTAILSSRIMNLNYPTGSKLFTHKDGTFNSDIIKKFVDATPEAFQDRKILDYLKAIKITSSINAKKARMTSISQWLFFFGIATIPIIIGVLIHAATTHNLTITYNH